MIRRIMQVEITPDEVHPDRCDVSVRDPKTKEVLVSIGGCKLSDWAPTYE